MILDGLCARQLATFHPSGEATEYIMLDEDDTMSDQDRTLNLSITTSAGRRNIIFVVSLNRLQGVIGAAARDRQIAMAVGVVLLVIMGLSSYGASPGRLRNWPMRPTSSKPGTSTSTLKSRAMTRSVALDDLQRNDRGAPSQA